MHSLSAIFDDKAATDKIHLEAHIWNFVSSNPGSETATIAEYVGLPEQECLTVLKGMMDRGLLAGELVKGKWY